LKGCLLSHKNVIAGTYTFIKRLEQGGWTMDYTDTLFTILPLAHVWERVNNHSVCIAIGGLAGFAEKPATIIRDLQALKPTLMILVTRLWDRLYNGIKTAICSTPEGKAKFEWAMDIGSQVLEKRMNEDGGIDINLDPMTFLEGQLRDDFEKANNEVFSIFRNALGGQVRAAGSGGAIMPADLQHDLWAMNFKLIDGWGLTESSAGANISMASDVKSGCLAKDFCPRVEGKMEEDGEILLRGDGIITEYFRNPEETAASFTPDGWFRTGDIGVYENGYLRIADRKKAILVLDTGKNVSPANIELKFTNSTVIEQIVIVGDNRKFISALVVPYYDNIIRLFKEKGLPVNESELVYAVMNGINTCIQAGSLAQHPYLNELIKLEIDEVNAMLNDFERIRKYTILPGKLLEEKGQLTPTLKVKTKAVWQDFAEEIAAMYEK
jgi:long-chain acyl-CoA synthetase